MANIIPPLNKQTLSRMTGGEKRFAQRLKALLDDDYLVWYDISVSKNRRYPDFIILHPSHGLLFLEVKDWKLSTLREINKSDVSLLTKDGLVTKPHPLEQARQYTYKVVDMLSRDPLLRRTTGSYKGNLIVPYGWGCLFTNISRQQIQKSIPDDRRDDLLPDHLMIYQNDMTEHASTERFQEQLLGMFEYQFVETLTLPQIDRIRWHLFPEVRIDDAGQADLFDSDKESLTIFDQSLPDIIKIMDLQQEQLARSLGNGPRVIHGVAGSGKTLILEYRCLYLARTMSRPILVLCFNITLAAKLRAFISAKGISGQVQVYHFHGWCRQQIKTYHVDMVKSEKPAWECQVDTVIGAVDKGQIPKAQYAALLIDEGHDFEAEWLKLVTQMVDPETGSLLLLYDDAQDIYKKRSGLSFSLSSVGVRAKGRTTILRVNYRNTREIFNFACAFARDYIDPRSADDDHIPLIEPMAEGNSGPKPEVREFNTLADEISFTVTHLEKWHEQGTAWGDMAVLYPVRAQGDQLATELKKALLPLWMASGGHKAAYQPRADKISLLTIHSSKGLEFSHVIIIGVGSFGDVEEKLFQNVRLLYTGMTRAMKCLLITASTENKFSKKLSAIAVQ